MLSRIPLISALIVFGEKLIGRERLVGVCFRAYPHGFHGTVAPGEV